MVAKVVEEQSMPPLAELFPLEEAPDHLPRWRRKKIDKSTVYRWAREGAHGIRLRFALVGNRKHTHEKWLREFITELTNLQSEAR